MGIKYIILQSVTRASWFLCCNQNNNNLKKNHNSHRENHQIQSTIGTDVFDFVSMSDNHKDTPSMQEELQKKRAKVDLETNISM